MKSRVESAIEFLKEGRPFTVGNLRLVMNGENGVIVMGWSQYLQFANLTKAISIEELFRIKKVFSDLLNDSQNMKDFVVDKSIEYMLCFDDGGKVSIPVCTEKDGMVNWFTCLR